MRFVSVLAIGAATATISVPATAQSGGSAPAKPAAQAAARPATQAPTPAPAGPVPVPRTNFIATMDAEFRTMDADRNGIVTRTEIEQYQRAAAATQAQARNRALFAQLDTDRNGQLSPAEFARLQTQVAAPNAAPVLSQNDGNRDGSISLVEWRTAKLANFDRLDTDKDGVVSVAEMRAGGVIK